MERRRKYNYKVGKWYKNKFESRTRTTHPYRHALRGFIDIATAGLTANLGDYPEDPWSSWQEDPGGTNELDGEPEDTEIPDLSRPFNRIWSEGQATTQELPTQSTQEMKRARAGSYSTISSSTPTRAGPNEETQVLNGTKVQEKYTKRVGSWKKPYISTSAIVKALFPLVHLQSAYVFTSRITSLKGQQMITSGTNSVLNSIFTRSYLQQIYRKLVYEVNAFKMSEGVGAFPGHVEDTTAPAGVNSAAVRPYFPALHCEKFERIYTAMNTGSTPAVITFIEFLCVDDTAAPPQTYWTDDLAAEPHATVASTQYFAPTTANLQLYGQTDPGRMPSDRTSTTLGKFWHITRKTAYECGVGQTIRHKIYHNGATIEADNIFKGNNSGAPETIWGSKGCTRQIMIITQGCRGVEKLIDSNVGNTDDGEIGIMPSYFAVRFDENVYFRCPFRQLSYQKFTLVPTSVNSWTSDTTLYQALDDLLTPAWLDPQATGQAAGGQDAQQLDT